VKLAALAALTAAGCITASQAPYPVDAVAQLAPLEAGPPYITGPIEVLGTGMPEDVATSAVRTFAAYHVQLPDGLEALIVLENAASCADREPLMAPDDPVPSQLVGSIRRVGDETHFFTVTPVGDSYRDVDTETATAFASPHARFPRVVVAVVLGEDAPVRSCGVLTWR
jgi:hypothetical protein